MNLKNQINKIVEAYNNKPEINIITKGSKIEIHLNSGNYGAREDVENYFESKDMIEFVQNAPKKKIIGLK